MLEMWHDHSTVLPISEIKAMFTKLQLRISQSQRVYCILYLMLWLYAIISLTLPERELLDCARHTSGCGDDVNGITFGEFALCAKQLFSAKP